MHLSKAVFPTIFDPGVFLKQIRAFPGREDFQREYRERANYANYF
jgi:hypothetical protein